MILLIRPQSFEKYMMKAIYGLLMACLFLTACIREPARPVVYTEYMPILLSKNLLPKSISVQAAQPIIDAAKIYHKSNFIYISERFKGIHLIDNTNPANPINKGFVAIPGCVDIAIKKEVLYADNAIDLVAIDLKALELGNLQVLKRIADVFPEVAPPDGGAVPDKFNQRNRPENTIIVGWRKQN